MEDSQVLDAESKAAPLQAPEAITDNEFLKTVQPNRTPNQNIYGNTSGIVGEKDHASEIANNMNKSDYNYNSAVDSSKNPEVITQSTTRHNVTPETTWKDEYTMDDTYKMTDTADYSWNKLAQEREQSVYNQEASQVLSDYAKSMQAINEAATQAMDQFFSAMYDSNQTADKMGWDGGGQSTSEERKVAFLKAATAANMYSKDELQRYGVESQLSVAREYAEADMKAYALELYQNELDKAMREAELTGFYISPEASEIMKQEGAADKILNDPKATQIEKDRATRVRAAAYAYYDKLGFEKSWTDPTTGEVVEYPGVKILSTYQLEETIRANKENERLQDQANKIAERANEIAGDAASAAQTAADNLHDLQLKVQQQTEAMQKEIKDRQDAQDKQDKYDRAVSAYGTFSNGYQPKGIYGHGKLEASGAKVQVEDKINNKKGEQNIWKTPDGYYWYWDGTKKEYIRCSKDIKNVVIQ